VKGRGGSGGGVCVGVGCCTFFFKLHVVSRYQFTSTLLYSSAVPQCNFLQWVRINPFESLRVNFDFCWI